MDSIVDYADLIDFLNSIDTKLVKILIVDMCPCKVTKLFKYISEKYIFSTHFEKQPTQEEIEEIHNLMKKVVLENDFEYESSWGVIDYDAEKIIDIQDNLKHVLEIYNLPKHYFLHGKLEKTLKFMSLCNLLSEASDEYISNLFDYACWFYPSNELCDHLLQLVSDNVNFRHHLSKLSSIERNNLKNMGYEYLIKKYTSRKLHNVLTFCELSRNNCRNLFYIINCGACEKILSIM